MINHIDVTIIITCYNGRETILETLNTALNQQDVDVQVIVINDGSTDDSENILFEAGMMDRITYLSQVNQGVSVALNNAISHATGKYCTLLDQDDLLNKSFCSKMLKIVKEKKMRIGYCNYEYFLHEDPTRKIALAYPKYEGNVQGKIISEHFIPTTGSVLFERNIIDAIRFDPEISGPQDWLFWIKLLMTEPICYYPESLIRIRIRKDSLSRKKNKMAHEVIKVMEKVEAIVMENKNNIKCKDIALFYFRYSGYLFAIGKYKMAVQKWMKGNGYHIDLASNIKLFAKMILKILKLDRKVENVLWKFREQKGMIL